VQSDARAAHYYSTENGVHRVKVTPQLKSAQFWPIRTENKHKVGENRKEKYGLIGFKDRI